MVDVAVGRGMVFRCPGPPGGPSRVNSGSGSVFGCAVCRGTGVLVAPAVVAGGWGRWSF